MIFVLRERSTRGVTILSDALLQRVLYRRGCASGKHNVAADRVICDGGMFAT